MSQPTACQEPDCRRQHPHQHCVVCSRAFNSQIIPPPSICGAIACRARHDWGPEDWAGQARMAKARRDAGLELNDLDREALALTDLEP